MWMPDCFTDQLHQKDQMTRKCCDEKMRVIQEMLEIYNNENVISMVNSVMVPQQEYIHCLL